MISFQILDSGKKIQIEVDDVGIERLIGVLNSLRGSGSHVHLRSPSSGGRDLEDATPWGEPAVPEVLIGHGGD